MDIYSLRHVGHFLVSPINHTLVFVLLIALFSMIKPSFLKAAKISSIAALCWLFLCSQAYFSHSLLKPLEDFTQVIEEDAKVIQNNKSIFVLACYLRKQKPLPIVSGWRDCSLQRLVQAAILYHKKPVPIFISGGDFLDSEGISYTNEATKLLQGLGVDTKDIRAIPVGTNTMEEMSAVYPLLPKGQTTLISSASHMHRISLFNSALAQTHSPDILLFPVDHLITSGIELSISMPSSHSIEITERALYEYLAIWVQRHLSASL